MSSLLCTNGVKRYRRLTMTQRMYTHSDKDTHTANLTPLLWHHIYTDKRRRDIQVVPRNRIAATKGSGRHGSVYSRVWQSSEGGLGCVVQHSAVCRSTWPCDVGGEGHPGSYTPTPRLPHGQDGHLAGWPLNQHEDLSCSLLPAGATRQCHQLTRRARHSYALHSSSQSASCLSNWCGWRRRWWRC